VYLAGAKPGMENARYVPVPEGQLLQEGMNDWESWINARNDVPLLVKAALGHYQFETLHPFTDGNGRMGRLVVTLQLVDGKALRYPILNISTYFEPRKDRYKDLLLHCSQTAEFDEWVQFFCDAVEAQAKEEIARIDALLNFRTKLLEELKAANAKGVVLDIVDDLIAYPVITASQAASMHNVSYPPANNAIQKLVDMGHLDEVMGRQYGRVLCAGGYAPGGQP
jgi:Fic family protein